jgi:hypothetical protein
VSAAKPILRLGNYDPPDNRKQSGTNYSNAGKVRLYTNRYNLISYGNWRGSILRSRLLNPFLATLVFASMAVIAAADAVSAEETSVILTPAALAEMKQVEAEIDRIEAQTLERLAAPPDNQVQQIELLGKLMLYDKNPISEPQ